MTEDRIDKVIRFVAITRDDISISTVPYKDGTVNLVLVLDCDDEQMMYFTYEQAKDIWSLLGEMLETMKGKI